MKIVGLIEYHKNNVSRRWNKKNKKMNTYTSWFLKQPLVLTLLRFVIRNLLFLFYIEMKAAWKAILMLLYYEQLFGTPLISDKGCHIWPRTFFRPPSPFYLDPTVYWYIGYLSDSSLLLWPSPYYLELESTPRPQ